MSTFGELLRRLRREQGLSLRIVARSSAPEGLPLGDRKREGQPAVRQAGQENRRAVPAGREIPAPARVADKPVPHPRGADAHGPQRRARNRGLPDLASVRRSTDSSRIDWATYTDARAAVMLIGRDA